MLEPRPLAESAAIARTCGADAVVVTGRATGHAPAPEEIRDACQGASACPVLVGSGLDAGNAEALLAFAKGAIVGTSLKTGNRVDVRKVQAVVGIARTVGSVRT